MYEGASNARSIFKRITLNSAAKGRLECLVRRSVKLRGGETMDIEKVAFESKEPVKGFTVKASYLTNPNNEYALVQIFRDGEQIRQFLFPAYKIWNIAAHFEDIVSRMG